MNGIVLLRQRVDDLCRWRRNHITNLVNHTRERRSEGRWRKLVQVDWNDTPSTLHKELHKESTRTQALLSLRQNPSRDDETGDKRCNDDRAAAAVELREVADDGTADAGADFHDDRGAGGLGVIKRLAREHEGCVGVLRRVGVVVEPSHEDDAVDDHLPFLGHHHLCGKVSLLNERMSSGERVMVRLTLVSFQKAPALTRLCPAALASMN